MADVPEPTGVKLFRRPPDLLAHLDGLLAQLLPGRVTHCGQLARALGDVAAARWVGSELLHNRSLRRHPLHRVIRADGTLGVYFSGDLDEKRRHLESEGVSVSSGRIDVAAYGQSEFQSSRPLAQLQRAQQAAARKFSPRPVSREIRTVAGLDISYAGEHAVAAYAEVDVLSGELLYDCTLSSQAPFPYVTSYLSFREVPLLIELLDEVRAQRAVADVLLIDGSGILHPRRAGSAAHLGIIAGRPTIGVTKKLLCGRVDINSLEPLTPAAVIHEGETLGWAIRPRATSNRPIFASPGNLVSVDDARHVTLAMLRGRNLPEPIYWADKLSRQEVRS